MKPGITSPASLKYRNEEEILAQQTNPKEYNDNIIFPDKVRINMNYLKNWSLGTDIKIILYTVLNKDLKEEYFN
jgi:lipopolysaccharide/colanic/teichoic acid biosynthesis glycosyltransferase